MHGEDTKKVENAFLRKMFFSITTIHQKLFVRKRFYKLNMLLYRLGLNGIGILNYKSFKESGEKSFLDTFLKAYKSPVIFDVGANIGDYSEYVKQHTPSSIIYAFEPHPKTFCILQKRIKIDGFRSFNIGMGDEKKVVNIYDYKNNDGSAHASLFSEVITDIHGKNEVINHQVDITTLDIFSKENDISHIDLLKIDTEGNELNVLKGATDLLQKGKISVVHFEFNEMNVVSRSFFKDFSNLLKDFTFYRMLPDGLIPMGKYKPLTHEIFAYQNIVAIHTESLFTISR